MKQKIKLQTKLNLIKIKRKKLLLDELKDTSRIMYQDLVGFIPEMQGWIKIHKSVNVTHHLNKMKDKNCMTVSIDAKSI